MDPNDVRRVGVIGCGIMGSGIVEVSAKAGLDVIFVEANDEFRERGIPLSIDVLKFIKFMVTDIFPGARLPSSQMMRTHGEGAGFVLDDVVSLRPHYVRTLTMWGDALEANKSRAIEIQSEEVYDNYMKYLRGCAQKFADEYIDVHLVTYLKPGATA